MLWIQESLFHSLPLGCRRHSRQRCCNPQQPDDPDANRPTDILSPTVIPPVFTRFYVRVPGVFNLFYEVFYVIVIQRTFRIRHSYQRKLFKMVEIKSKWVTPAWCSTPQDQIRRARRLWPDVVLPSPPTEFTPKSKSEILLLHVPDTFDNLWDKIEITGGCVKSHWKINTDSERMRLTPGRVEFIEPVWLAFDPEYGRSTKPNSILDRSSLAAGEVLSALIQFPDWCFSWFDDASAPILSGYQVLHNGAWSHVPFLDWMHDRRKLELYSDGAGDRYRFWASPIIRKEF